MSRYDPNNPLSFPQPDDYNSDVSVEHESRSWAWLACCGSSSSPSSSPPPSSRNAAKQAAAAAAHSSTAINSTYPPTQTVNHSQPSPFQNINHSYHQSLSPPRNPTLTHTPTTLTHTPTTTTTTTSAHIYDRSSAPTGPNPYPTTAFNSTYISPPQHHHAQQHPHQQTGLTVATDLTAFPPFPAPDVTPERPSSRASRRTIRKKKQADQTAAQSKSSTPDSAQPQHHQHRTRSLSTSSGFRARMMLGARSLSLSQSKNASTINVSSTSSPMSQRSSQPLRPPRSPEMIPAVPAIPALSTIHSSLSTPNFHRFEPISMDFLLPALEEDLPNFESWNRRPESLAATRILELGLDPALPGPRNRKSGPNRDSQIRRSRFGSIDFRHSSLELHRNQIKESPQSVPNSRSGSRADDSTIYRRDIAYSPTPTPAAALHHRQYSTVSPVELPANIDSSASSMSHISRSESRTTPMSAAVARAVSPFRPSSRTKIHRSKVKGGRQQSVELAVEELKQIVRQQRTSPSPQPGPPTRSIGASPIARFRREQVQAQTLSDIGSAFSRLSSPSPPPQEDFNRNQRAVVPTDSSSSTRYSISDNSTSARIAQVISPIPVAVLPEEAGWTVQLPEKNRIGRAFSISRDQQSPPPISQPSPPPHPSRPPPLKPTTVDSITSILPTTARQAHNSDPDLPSPNSAGLNSSVPLDSPASTASTPNSSHRSLDLKQTDEGYYNHQGRISPSYTSPHASSPPADSSSSASSHSFRRPSQNPTRLDVRNSAPFKKHTIHIPSPVVESPNDMNSYPTPVSSLAVSHPNQLFPLISRPADSSPKAVFSSHSDNSVATDVSPTSTTGHDSRPTSHRMSRGQDRSWPLLSSNEAVSWQPSAVGRSSSTGPIYRKPQAVDYDPTVDGREYGQSKDSQRESWRMSGQGLSPSVRDSGVTRWEASWLEDDDDENESIQQRRSTVDVAGQR